MITIIRIAMVQALYDLAGWYGIIKENREHKFSKLFRVIKELLDFIVIPAIAHLYFGVQLSTLAAFMIAKWCHLCDSFYNIYRYILTNEVTTDWADWRFWTPLGLLRCNFWGFCVIPGFTQYEYTYKLGHWREKGQNPLFIEYKDIGFSRGMVSIKEAWIQTAVGLCIAAIMLQIWG